MVGVCIPKVSLTFTYTIFPDERARAGAGKLPPGLHPQRLFCWAGRMADGSNKPVKTEEPGL